MDIYEILRYDRTSDHLFKDYINLSLEVRQESIECPKPDMTGEEKDMSIHEYEVKGGIKLGKNESRIAREKNHSQTHFVLILGKLSQRLNLRKTMVCKEYREYIEIADDPEKKILGEHSPNEKTILVSYDMIKDESADPGNTNIAIAPFVTSYARLLLYKYMKSTPLDKTGSSTTILTPSSSFSRREIPKSRLEISLEI